MWQNKSATGRRQNYQNHKKRCFFTGPDHAEFSFKILITNYYLGIFLNAYLVYSENPKSTWVFRQIWENEWKYSQYEFSGQYPVIIYGMTKIKLLACFLIIHVRFNQIILNFFDFIYVA